MPDWIWFFFIFAFGCCVGSFLNVIIYRLPRDKSIVRPGSACPACGRHIRFYDNIPLVSWLILGAKCRYCKASISPRYFVIELLAGVLFLGLFIVYFRTDLRAGVGLLQGGWFIYLLHIILLSAFIAASAIDLELWVIPLSICWFVTGAGLIGSSLGVYVIDPKLVYAYALLPSASGDILNLKEVTVASLAGGAVIGLAISLLLLATGLLKRSYETENTEQSSESSEKQAKAEFNHRQEIGREIIFLLPIIICSVAAYLVSQKYPQMHSWWRNSSQKPAIAGVFGSLWGYFVGCGLVWAVRILGTLGFNKEAMGLGDVHLMGAAGAVTGPVFVVAAFFIAPFFGLAWAAVQMLSRKTRQIPYGPFLSLGVLGVMIFHDRIIDYLTFIRYH